MLLFKKYISTSHVNNKAHANFNIGKIITSILLISFIACDPNYAILIGCLTKHLISNRPLNKNIGLLFLGSLLLQKVTGSTFINNKKDSLLFPPLNDIIQKQEPLYLDLNQINFYQDSIKEPLTNQSQEILTAIYFESLLEKKLNFNTIQMKWLETKSVDSPIKELTQERYPYLSLLKIMKTSSLDDYPIQEPVSVYSFKYIFSLFSPNKLDSFLSNINDYILEKKSLSNLDLLILEKDAKDIINNDYINKDNFILKLIYLVMHQKTQHIPKKLSDIIQRLAKDLHDNWHQQKQLKLASNAVAILFTGVLKELSFNKEYDIKLITQVYVKKKISKKHSPNLYQLMTIIKKKLTQLDTSLPPTSININREATTQEAFQLLSPLDHRLVSPYMTTIPTSLIDHFQSRIFQKYHNLNKDGLNQSAEQLMNYYKPLLPHYNHYLLDKKIKNMESENNYSNLINLLEDVLLLPTHNYKKTKKIFEDYKLGVYQFTNYLPHQTLFRWAHISEKLNNKLNAYISKPKSSHQYKPIKSQSLHKKLKRYLRKNQIYSLVQLIRSYDVNTKSKRTNVKNILFFLDILKKVVKKYHYIRCIEKLALIDDHISLNFDLLSPFQHIYLNYLHNLKGTVPITNFSKVNLTSLDTKLLTYANASLYEPFINDVIHHKIDTKDLLFFEIALNAIKNFHPEKTNTQIKMIEALSTAKYLFNLSTLTTGLNLLNNLNTSFSRQMTKNFFFQKNKYNNNTYDLYLGYYHFDTYPRKFFPSNFLLLNHNGLAKIKLDYNNSIPRLFTVSTFQSMSWHQNYNPSNKFFEIPATYNKNHYYEAEIDVHKNLQDFRNLIKLSFGDFEEIYFWEFDQFLFEKDDLTFERHKSFSEIIVEKSLKSLRTAYIFDLDTGNANELTTKQLITLHKIHTEIYLKLIRLYAAYLTSFVLICYLLKISYIKLRRYHTMYQLQLEIRSMETKRSKNRKTIKKKVQRETPKSRIEYFKDFKKLDIAHLVMIQTENQLNRITFVTFSTIKNNVHLKLFIQKLDRFIDSLPINYQDIYKKLLCFAMTQLTYLDTCSEMKDVSEMLTSLANINQQQSINNEIIRLKQEITLNYKQKDLDKLQSDLKEIRNIKLSLTALLQDQCKKALQQTNGKKIELKEQQENSHDLLISLSQKNTIHAPFLQMFYFIQYFENIKKHQLKYLSQIRDLIVHKNMYNSINEWCEFFRSDQLYTFLTEENYKSILNMKCLRRSQNKFDRNHQISSNKLLSLQEDIIKFLSPFRNKKNLTKHDVKATATAITSLYEIINIRNKTFEPLYTVIQKYIPFAKMKALIRNPVCHNDINLLNIPFLVDSIDVLTGPLILQPIRQLRYQLNVKRMKSFQDLSDSEDDY
ncbi:hypothetical protein DID75_04855 [Candidatus Marinamargulisbacteria bacterium SCGC AG-410-N11]|nr:hypothetical protein DID75_04855 [Candidatus Marinamargulisbacteria bacterium SCGC AG-410-N11]